MSEKSFRIVTPPGDDRERLVCETCGHVEYVNPRVVVGSVSTWEDRVLLCKRAIAPRKGYWTLPAGFLELRESAAEGAAREAWEEARARIEMESVLAVYTIEHISQVQIMFRGRLTSPDIEAGPESEEVALVRWEDIPWDELAFPSVRWALEQFREVRDLDAFPAFGNPPGERGKLP